MSVLLCNLSLNTNTNTNTNTNGADDDDGDDEEDEDGKDENYVCWESLKPPRLLHSKVLIGPLSPTQLDGDDDHLKYNQDHFWNRMNSAISYCWNLPDVLFGW